MLSNWGGLEWAAAAAPPSRLLLLPLLLLHTSGLHCCRRCDWLPLSVLLQARTAFQAAAASKQQRASRQVCSPVVCQGAAVRRRAVGSAALVVGRNNSDGSTISAAE
jgi:hypothetical protein